MKGQIYDAFVNAGFGEEARTLSTTTKGKTTPALGHYIAVLESMLDVEEKADLPNSEVGSKRRDRFFTTADKLFYYAKSSPELHEGLKSILNKNKFSRSVRDYLSCREYLQVKQ